MRVETTVVAEVVGTTMCCFDSLGQNIPTGARVTVEWDDSVHECDDLPARTDIIYNGQCWNVWERKEQGRIKQLSAVLYCPYCGRKLGG